MLRYLLPLLSSASLSWAQDLQSVFLQNTDDLLFFELHVRERVLVMRQGLEGTASLRRHSAARLQGEMYSKARDCCKVEGKGEDELIPKDGGPLMLEKYEGGFYKVTHLTADDWRGIKEQLEQLMNKIYVVGGGFERLWCDPRSFEPLVEGGAIE